MLKDRELTALPFNLSVDVLSQYTFVAGTTGSGKTTTCQKLLLEANAPFLVIEPAKTEYRVLLDTATRAEEKPVIFTLGDESTAPFRINPFELIEGENISSHIDMVKAAFTTAFPMEASMPQLLEEAIIRCYENRGWDLQTNTNMNFECGKDAFLPEADSFPTLSDLLGEIRSVVESKNFGDRLQGEYMGSLVSRLSNLTMGTKGSMLDCRLSTSFEYFLHHNVIIEMDELKSAEDKALFMGFILNRLSAEIKREHQKNPGYRHLTLVEEAHRLLSKTEYGDCGSKKSAVETFTDLLAEVRTYGEGLIVVDQIPNKLAPEVLKNTNTKIIHRILARDDKEVVGDTMMMDDRQKEYLSRLPRGQAVVYVNFR